MIGRPRTWILSSSGKRSQLSPILLDNSDATDHSHAHFDHCRPCSGIFPSAKVYFGPGTGEHCSPGHLQDQQTQWDGRFFSPTDRTENWEELSGPWQPFGAFEHAMDFFGDGSFWVIKAPGHMVGNLCAAARLPDGEYVLLAGDCCHSRYCHSRLPEISCSRLILRTRDILLGKCDFARFQLGDRLSCLQDDIPAAHGTLERIRKMEREHGFHVALAHDSTWLLDDRDHVLLELMDREMLESAKAAIPLGQTF